MKRTTALAVLDELAADQFGLVTAAQAKTAEVDAVTLLRLRDSGLLEGVGRGVYRLAGAVVPTHLEIRVAWLRLDPARPAWKRDGTGDRDAVVSHRSACLLHELGDIPAQEVELTVPRRRTTREAGVRLHPGVRPFEPGDITISDGLPVTTVERTIVDLLRSGADAGHVGTVIADAERRGLVDLESLAARAHGLGSRYAMPAASGSELLSALAIQAGHELEGDVVRRLVSDASAVGALAGYGMAIRDISGLSEDVLLRTLDAMLSAQLAPLRQAVDAMLAAQCGPSVERLRTAGIPENVRVTLESVMRSEARTRKVVLERAGLTASERSEAEVGGNRVHALAGGQ